MLFLSHFANWYILFAFRTLLKATFSQTVSFEGIRDNVPPVYKLFTKDGEGVHDSELPEILQYSLVGKCVFFFGNN